MYWGYVLDMYSDDFLFFSIHILYVLRNLKSKYDMDMMWSYVIKSVCIGGMCWSSMLWEYVMRPIIMYWICYEVIIYVLRIWVENRCHGNMYWENIMCFGYMCWNLYVLEVCFRTHRVCIERKGYVLGIPLSTSFPIWGKNTVLINSFYWFSTTNQNTMLRILK